MNTLPIPGSMSRQWFGTRYPLPPLSLPMSVPAIPSPRFSSFNTTRLPPLLSPITFRPVWPWSYVCPPPSLSHLRVRVCSLRTSSLGEGLDEKQTNMIVTRGGGVHLSQNCVDVTHERPPNCMPLCYAVQRYSTMDIRHRLTQN